MEVVNRKPFEGVTNILRFNWHFYVVVVAALGSLFLLKAILPATLHPLINALCVLAFLSTLTSIPVSFYIYDRSPLYTLTWLKATPSSIKSVVNVNAGFDEISPVLAANFPSARLTVLDFYDPQKHTEVSIKRARAAKPPFPGTKTISTNNLELADQSADLIICFLSAHEIRDANERTNFFRQLNYALRDEGKIIVVEHLRDVPNFLIYTVGAFHFHSPNSWKENFRLANLSIQATQKITPFITAFTLHKHGATS